MASDYKYDVAFSFLGRDEALATALNDMLKDRWRTFIYSERQKELVGKDGEQLLSQAFGQEARIVVVLYRAEWGKTPWTRVEETAIRNRAFDRGYDFTIFIPLDKPPGKPEWLPKNRLWVDLDRLGMPAAVAVIEARLQDAGAEAHPETVEQIAARIHREKFADSKREEFLATHGRDLAAKEAKSLLDYLSELATNINASMERLDERYMGGVQKDRHTVCVGWYPGPYANVMDDGRLNLALWNGLHWLKPGLRYYREQPSVIRETDFVFDVAPVTHEPLWKPERGNEPPLSTRALAEKAIRLLLAQIDKNNKR